LNSVGAQEESRMRVLEASEIGSDPAAALGALESDGYVVLRGFFEPRVITAARSALEGLVEQHAQMLRSEGRVIDTFRGEPFETRLLRLHEREPARAPNIFRTELHLAGLFDLFFHSRLLDLVERLLRPEIRLYPNYSVRPKFPDHAGTLVLWHQDAAYTDQRHRATEGAVTNLRMVNVWAPLVPARESNGCMQFVPGSHRLGVVPHVERQYYLEIVEEVMQTRAGEAVSIEADPTDVVLFSNLLFHRGLPNTSGEIRWSADWRYQDATQPTLRAERGHLARSRERPGGVVQSAEQWEALRFE
jgi:phytanoyl-CoA hydroxylase